MNMKTTVRKILGEKSLGVLEFCLRPGQRASWGGPFNGQVSRQAMFLEIVRRIRFAAIVETGTYRGTTTEYMHTMSGLPVHTVELSPRYYAYAKTRFVFTKGVSVYCDDSRGFLRRITDHAGSLEKENVFFYLDAHWEADLPLRDEIQLIFTRFPRAVVMVDDFKVPHDREYAYDAYGEGRTLSLEYIASVTTTASVSVFFPTVKAARETGAKRGCVVLARAGELVEQLLQTTALARYSAEVSA